MLQDESINAPETFSTEEEQLQELSALNAEIDKYGSIICASFEVGKIDNVIDAASKLISVLRNSSLTPKNYYKIYHSVSTILLSIFQNIQIKEQFSNRKIAELYETVQYLPGCIERLYLMITVGTELGRRQIVRVNDILDDLHEMSLAVQNPIRALFLRHFLLSIFKQYLPDQNEKATERSLSFLLNNFAQMNRMWVRIEDLMGSDERKEQREEFSVLIGTNIQRISALNGIDVQKYSTIILPFIAKHVELCEDSMAQDFILRSIIHAFPEEFHIATIDQLFAVFSKVEQGVNILDIVNQLLERFLQYIGNLIDPTKSSEVFVTIAKNIEELFNAEGHLSLTSKFKTLQKLLKFALKINNKDVKNIKNLLKFTDFHIELAIGEESITDKEQSQYLKELLQVPLGVFTSAQYLYKLEHLPVLIDRLTKEDRLEVADIVCESFIKSETKITNTEELDFYIHCTNSLVTEAEGSSSFFSILHLIEGESTQERIDLLEHISNKLDNMTEVAAERFVVPFSMILLQIYTKYDSKPAFTLLNSFIEENSTEYPSKVVNVCSEILRLSTKRNNEENSKKAYDLIVKELPLIQKPTAMYHTLESVMHLLSDMSIKCDELFDIIEDCVKTVRTVFRKVKIMCGLTLFVWNKAHDNEKVIKLLEQAIQIVLDKGNEGGEILNSYYSILDTMLILIDYSSDISEEFIVKIVTLISVKHKEVIGNGKRLDSVVTPNGKRFYLNLARYIQKKDLIKD